jgi:probable phosphoglycerate mutase
MPSQRVFLIRHGETEWSLSGQHTGTTDIPLTESGRKAAQRLGPILAKVSFELILTSPLQRARKTCELSGLGERAEIDRDLMNGTTANTKASLRKRSVRRRPGG